MICELCGRNFIGGKKVRIEGSVVVACDRCASLGEVVGPAGPVLAPVKKSASSLQKAAASNPAVSKASAEGFKVEVEVDLVEDYGRKIKAAREKMNLKQEDLGRLMNETASFIHHLELGQIEPKPEIARKLQAKLGIKLLQTHFEEDGDTKPGGARGLTLGDVVVVKNRERK